MSSYNNDKPIKICYLTSALGGNYIDGWSRYSHDLLQAIKADGEMEISVLAEAGFTSYETPGIFINHILPNDGKVISSLFWLFYNYPRLSHEVKVYDRAHCLIEPYIPITYFLFRRKKYFITLHGTYIINYLQRPKLRWLFARALKKAETVFCVSAFTANKLRELIGLDNIKIITNGIDYKKFEQSAKDKKENEKFRLITVGALKYRKGMHLVIEALNKIKNELADFEYVIVGDQSIKEYLDILKSKIKEYGLEKNVIFKENLSDDELIDEYQNSDLFVMTPVSDSGDFEGFGLVYLEANACGLPVIGAYGSGAEEAIRKDYSGLIVDPNPEKIAEAILKLYNDQDMRKRFGENGRQWARENDWSMAADKYLKAYKSAV